MTTDDIDPRMLRDLRGLREVADDLALDPPPLPDVRRRADRRHRARLGRNAGGVTAALVAAGVLAVALLPPPRGAPGGNATARTLPRVQLAGTVVPAPAAEQVCVMSAVGTAQLPDEMLRLPADAPAGLRLSNIQARAWSGCGYPALSAWHVDGASSRLDARVQVNVGTPATKALPGTGRCARIVLEGQPGRCVTVVVGGRERPVWLWDSKKALWGDGRIVSWADGRYLWTMPTSGLDDGALKDLLAGLRTYADGTVTGSLPGGFQAWQPPREIRPSLELTATYLEPGYSPNDPKAGPSISIRVTNDPASDPFAGFLMQGIGNSSEEQPRIVDVDGHRGLWSVDATLHQMQLTWSVGNGVSIQLVTDSFDGMTLDKAMEIARDIRQVPRTDPRLPPAEMPSRAQLDPPRAP